MAGSGARLGSGMTNGVIGAALGLALLGAGGCSTTPEAAELGEVPSAEQLYQEAKDILADGTVILWYFDTTKYEQAIDKLQDIIDNYPYSDLAVVANLEIADTYFRREGYEEALSYYRDFAELHPDHPRVAYALHRAALCHYRQSQDPGRDQSATKLAVTQLEDLMRRFPDSPEAREGEALWRELRTRLGSHVMQIGDFYLDREEYQSAASRYRAVLDGYPGLGLDPEALYKLAVCYERMNLTDEASQIFQVILDNYRDTEVAESAAELLPPDQVPSAN